LHKLSPFCCIENPDPYVSGTDFTPTTADLAAGRGCVGLKTLLVSLGALDGSHQFRPFQFAYLDAVPLRNYLDLFQFIDSSPLICLSQAGYVAVSRYVVSIAPVVRYTNAGARARQAAPLA